MDSRWKKKIKRKFLLTAEQIIFFEGSNKSNFRTKNHHQLKNTKNFYTNKREEIPKK